VLILIIVVGLTLFISANCSLYEAVLYSARMGTLEAARQQKRTQKLAGQFIAFKQKISEPIAAILILNTIANTAGATIAGMYATRALGAVYVPIFSIVFTLAILFLAEILPKTMGVVHWRTIWPMIIYPVKIMKYVLYPAIFLTQQFSAFITKDHRPVRITEDEILALVHMGAREGEITQDESQMVRNIIKLEEIKARSIMTPRTIIFSLDSNTTIEEAFSIIRGKGFSRIPVYDEHREKIVGYVMSQDIILAKAQNQDKSMLKSIARPIQFMTGSANCLTLLKNFLKQRLQMAILVDEFGGVAGLVTLEDLLETLLGTEIVDETDQAVDWQDVARKRKRDQEEEGQ
jgi:CBS domain containing-hemolysin-like protein